MTPLRTDALLAPVHALGVLAQTAALPGLPSTWACPRPR